MNVSMALAQYLSFFHGIERAGDVERGASASLHRLLAHPSL